MPREERQLICTRDHSFWILHFSSSSFHVWITANSQLLWVPEIKNSLHVFGTIKRVVFDELSSC